MSGARAGDYRVVAVQEGGHQERCAHEQVGVLRPGVEAYQGDGSHEQRQQAGDHLIDSVEIGAATPRRALQDEVEHHQQHADRDMYPEPDLVGGQQCGSLVASAPRMG